MSARREASKRLGMEFQKRYEALALAVGQEEISRAAMSLGTLFNENIEQVVWFLKAYGGVKQLPLEKRQPAATPKLPELPAFLTK